MRGVGGDVKHGWVVGTGVWCVCVCVCVCVFVRSLVHAFGYGMPASLGLETFRAARVKDGWRQKASELEPVLVSMW